MCKWAHTELHSVKSKLQNGKFSAAVIGQYVRPRDHSYYIIYDKLCMDWTHGQHRRRMRYANVECNFVQSVCYFNLLFVICISGVFISAGGGILQPACCGLLV